MYVRSKQQTGISINAAGVKLARVQSGQRAGADYQVASVYLWLARWLLCRSVGKRTDPEPLRAADSR